jgi:hypothetical protein
MPEAIEVLRAARANRRQRSPLRPIGWLLILLGVVVIMSGVVLIVLSGKFPAAAFGFLGGGLIKWGLTKRQLPVTS